MFCCGIIFVKPEREKKKENEQMKKLMTVTALALGAACYGECCCSQLKPIKWADDAFASGVWTKDADGVLTASKDAAIWSADVYENFTLSFEYKLDPAANSGVIIYCSDVKRWVPNSVEVQLLDDNAPKWAKDAPYLKNSSLYGHLAPLATPAKPAGEWNKMTITAKGKKIVVTVNGVKTIDADLSKWTDAKVNPDGTKIPPWLSRPWAELDTKGRIGFQGMHGGAKPYFRNVKVGPAK